MSFAASLQIILPLAFVTGFALQRGQVCSVLAARQLVEAGRTSRLIGFFYAAAWALVLTLPLVWARPDLFQLSPVHRPTLITVLAGAVYGFGAFVNGACLFGICSRAVSGSLHFFAAVPGLAIGTALALQLDVEAITGPRQLSPLARPGVLSLSMLAIALVVVVAHGRGLAKNFKRAGLRPRDLLRLGRWRSSFALAVIGVTGGLLFATGEVWNYAGLLRIGGARLLGFSDAIAPSTIIGPIALFAGACASLYLGGRFAFKAPALGHVVRSFIGGSIMGAAATLVPGGNDIMILYAMPSLALHGVVAYVAMMATLIALGWLARRRFPVLRKAGGLRSIAPVPDAE